MKQSFAEYDSCAGPAQLYIILQDVPDQDLATRLRGLAGCSGVEVAGDGLLAAQADSSVDMDDFLRRAAHLIADAGAEIIESRLSSSVYENCGPVVISSMFSALAPGASYDKHRPGHHYISLESGTSFGSGQHPSTRLAVQALQTTAELYESFPQRVLDIGCGSGILSLVCAKLGAEYVLGIDISPPALMVARRNVILNDEDDTITIDDLPLSEINQQFNLLVANISPFVLQGLIPELPHLLYPDGQLVLAGMRKAQLSDIRRAMNRVGLRGRERIYEDGQWVGMLKEIG